MFDPEKLKTNAITSIRHGVEDFQLSQSKPSDGGDPTRALSAARNLFAGMLLLFKYRITQEASTSDDAVRLIFNPPEVLPHPDGIGGVIWKPVGNFKKTTIDVGDIRNRFNTFKISIDWDAISRLQNERNHLEHLHPASAHGVVAGFVADLFPVLRSFIVDELEDVPASLLGNAWKIMLAHHDFFEKNVKECKEMWDEFEIPKRMRPALDQMQCENCRSHLIQPTDDGELAYVCRACGNSGNIFPELEGQLVDVLGGYNPYDGEEPPTRTCPSCDYDTFVVVAGECYWCDHELEDHECSLCGDSLCLDDQDNHGLCGYCSYKLSKDD